MIEATIGSESVPPLALQALPLLGEAPRASEPPVVLGPRGPTPKRAVKRATLTLVSRKQATRKSVDPPRQDAAAPPVGHQMVDDGF
jgi:hypothetical protein